MRSNSIRLAVLVLLVVLLGRGSVWADDSLPGKGTFTNTIGMSLKLIPAGEFQMGSSAADVEKAVRLVPGFSKAFADNEQPQHRVQITQAFYMGQHEVTIGQFRKFVTAESYKSEAESDGQGGSGFDESKDTYTNDPKYTWRTAGFTQTDEHPVVNVSWNDAQKFCGWLSRTDRRTYRLPTEAEWEYAARGGTTTLYPSGDDPESIVKIGNIFDATAKAKFDFEGSLKASDGYVFTAPVGRFAANGFGLYDVTGNVWEWCEDVYDTKSYASRSGLTIDPKVVTGSESRVLRGGSWGLNPRVARLAVRVSFTPGDRNFYFGFRVVCVSLARTR